MDTIKALSILRHQSERHPSTLTARELTRKYNIKFKTEFNWHEASIILDQAHQYGLIRVAGCDLSGMRIYRF